MATKTVDKQMQEYLKLKKTLDQYYRLKILLETVRRPDLQAAVDESPKPLVHPKTKTKRRKYR
ncbi:MAG TPA: hypothetical protein VF666_10210 [Pyrinomonadaceae bacterium]